MPSQIPRDFMAELVQKSVVPGGRQATVPVPGKLFIPPSQKRIKLPTPKIKEPSLKEKYPLAFNK